jgi:hypothetical protein
MLVFTKNLQLFTFLSQPDKSPRPKAVDPTVDVDPKAKIAKKRGTFC